MKSIRQLFRQPFKTLAGILLVAMATAVLCVSFSQKMAAADTAAQLRNIYITVALPTGLHVPNRQQWIQMLLDERPDLISGSIRQGLASAYIPALTLDNHTSHKNQNDDAYDMTNANLQPTCLSYSGAMLEIEITEIPDMPHTVADHNMITVEDIPGAYTRQINAKILRVIGLQEGYFDPTGFTVHIALGTADWNAFSQLPLQVGSRYLIYGNDYQDLDWQLRDDIAETMTWRQEEALPEWVLSTLAPQKYHPDRYKCRIGDLYHGLTPDELLKFRTCKISVLDQSLQEAYGYNASHFVPSIVPLDGTAEDFLCSPSGALWQQALDDIQINCHTFPVIGTDNLKSVAAFSLGNADIYQGRDFSSEEISSGAKVCIISRSMADANGLQVGDTLELNYYTYDFDNPHQQFISKGEGIVNPRGYSYFSPTMTMGSTQVYKIVGLYEQDTPWGSVENDLYSFTPNTVFVPHASVTGSMDYANEGQFLTLIVHSDQLYSLQMLSVAENMDGIFEYYDNGYNALADTLKNYEAAAGRILPIGIVVYGIIILLFLFLYPARAKRTLSQMDSLGAGHSRRVWHVLISTMGPVIPGSLAGAFVSIVLWQRISDALQEYMQTDLAIILDTAGLWAVAGIQAACIAAATTALGIWMSCHLNAMDKR